MTPTFRFKISNYFFHKNSFWYEKQHNLFFCFFVIFNLPSSLGLVLYETMTRRDPWKDTLMSTTEIIQGIREGELLRPDLEKLKGVSGYVRKCIASCWQEEPDRRPDMKLVSVILKPMQSGLYVILCRDIIELLRYYNISTSWQCSF